tara:strand:+ start:399 stop:695 length:297 start_codon:yes stop_codon:yes gene_type:complete
MATIKPANIAAKLARRVALRVNRAHVLSRRKVLFKSARRRGKFFYRWKTRKDNDVRHTHKALEGKTFNMYTGAAVNNKYPQFKHPGDDFNCRCGFTWL